MINGKKIIALIPARGGSKSIPKKNIALLGGKPLISWSIEVAKAIDLIDEIIVSTDCKEIAEVAKKFGAKVQERPSELANDSSLVIDTVRYVLSNMENYLDDDDYLLLLEPTCPLRSEQDIKSCINLIETEQLDSVATYKEAELNPHRAWKIIGNKPTSFIDGVNPWLPRQELPMSYQLNGAIYLSKVGVIDEKTVGLVNGNIGAIVMPKERSIDIDHPIDLLVAEVIVNG
ncbi:acylneuraminate cytidylyltransferase family protein [Lysinibacillus sphaericus]|uniref:acylneuraminate cytidylyltransferase family protein n=1 Tax=Lysinibacillus TaxID=400634 RepID=UPI0004DF5258|nr:acylneuraminate cytidylyltransferase family protein [Lysinibacillus sphaericus]MDM5351411.1 acylneuraminate cytidylyltransferase family protein [Lysinibacillus sphaericus]MEB7451900.1 acylneuraminate cytidylyltransferase family protein [Lysinibacillus sphaericus]QPA59393.1 acylneuraminate cytidylyltransferase family protein [Lysinibacillus sphaericus]